MSNSITNSSIIARLAEAQSSGKKVYLYKKQGEIYADSSQWGRILRCITTFLGLRNYNLTEVCGLQLQDKQWKSSPAAENPLRDLFQKQIDRKQEIREMELSIIYLREKLRKKGVLDNVFENETKALRDLRTKERKIEKNVALHDEFHRQPPQDDLDEKLGSILKLNLMPESPEKKEMLKRRFTELRNKVEQEVTDRMKGVSELDLSDNDKVEALFAEEIAWLRDKVQEVARIVSIENACEILPPRNFTNPQVFLSNSELLYAQWQQGLSAKELVESVNSKIYLPGSLVHMVVNEYAKHAKGDIPQVRNIEIFYHLTI